MIDFSGLVTCFRRMPPLHRRLRTTTPPKLYTTHLKPSVLQALLNNTTVSKLVAVQQRDLGYSDWRALLCFFCWFFSL
jgi:hypothetical protein